MGQNRILTLVFLSYCWSKLDFQLLTYQNGDKEYIGINEIRNFFKCSSDHRVNVTIHFNVKLKSINGNLIVAKST